MNGGLGAREGALVRVAAAQAAAGAGARGPDLETALKLAASDAHPREVEEVLLQSVLFLGYPASLNGFAVWRRVSGRAADVPGAPSEAQPVDYGTRGERVCRAVYGGQYGRLRDNVRALHPDMERWMVAEGYGRVLGRPGLDLATRELCICALLVVADAPRQLYSHLRGALNVGAAPDALEAALEEACRAADSRAVRSAREVWEGLQARRDPGGRPSDGLTGEPADGSTDGPTGGSTGGPTYGSTDGSTDG